MADGWCGFHHANKKHFASTKNDMGMAQDIVHYGSWRIIGVQRRVGLMCQVLSVQ